MFTGAYLLGVLAALVAAFALKRTILRGESRPLVLELPSYKVAELEHGGVDDAGSGVGVHQKAGTVILAISIICGRWRRIRSARRRPKQWRYSSRRRD